MNSYCKGCRNHHSAGHPKDSPLAKKYNDWCCHHSRNASKAVGHCKIHGGRVTQPYNEGDKK